MHVFTELVAYYVLKERPSLGVQLAYPGSYLAEAEAEATAEPLDGGVYSTAGLPGWLTVDGEIKSNVRESMRERAARLSAGSAGHVGGGDEHAEPLYELGAGGNDDGEALYDTASNTGAEPIYELGNNSNEVTYDTAAAGGGAGEAVYDTAANRDNPYTLADNGGNAGADADIEDAAYDLATTAGETAYDIATPAGEAAYDLATTHEGGSAAATYSLASSIDEGGATSGGAQAGFAAAAAGGGGGGSTDGGTNTKDRELKKKKSAGSMVKRLFRWSSSSSQDKE